MHTLVEKLARAALLAAGLLLFVGVAPAGADDIQSGSSGDGVLAGNVVNVDLDAPVTICGLLSALFGTGANGCTTLPISLGGSTDAARSGASGDGVVSGNAVNLDLDIPVDLGCLPGCGTLPACVPTCTPATTCCVPPTTCYCTTTTSSTTTSSTSSTSSTSVPSTTSSIPTGRRLPVTGSDLGLQLPVGAGLVAAGALFVWASRRRMARFD